MSTKSKPANLEERYHYRSKKRSTVEGLALEALSGDRTCVAHLAAYGQVLMEHSWKENGALADAAWWLASIMGDIARGVSPNQAFGYEQGPGARDRWKPEEFEKLRKHWFLAKAVSNLAQRLTGMTYSDAVTEVETIWKVSATDATSAMGSLAPTKKKLSATAAKELALDVVEKLGAGTHRASRATISKAYSDLIRQD